MIKKVIVCGLGSMGKRRINILRSLHPEIDIFGVDTSELKRHAAADKFKIKTGSDFFSAFNRFLPHAVFVCSSPLSHMQTVLYSLEKGVHTFSEINLSIRGYDRIINEAKKRGILAFLSSTPLYREEIQWLIKYAQHKRVSYRYHVGQYLPDWHPWESHKDFFVANKDTNAVREIMAIEFPWILKAFGRVVDYRTLRGEISELDLGYPDTYQINLKHDQGTMGTLTFDCVCVKAVRRLELYSEHEYVQWEGVPDTLEVFSRKSGNMEPVQLYDSVVRDKHYDNFIIENPYIEEVKDFFSRIEKDSTSVRYSYEEDRVVLDMIDKIENR